MTTAITPEALADGSAPFHSVSDAMRAAIEKASDDATRARERLGQTGARISEGVCRFAYTSSYMVSYGTVYLTVFVVRSLPRHNPVMDGFVDGGRAALEALNEARSATDPTAHRA